MGVISKLRAALLAPAKPQPRQRLPRRELAPVADIVEQGLLVADVAVRMTVKNHLIVRALKHQANYSAAETQEQVRCALAELITEREKDAANIRVMRAQIRTVGFAAGGENEYHREDSATLQHRQEVYEGVAAQLRERLTDSAYLERVAKAATELAWAEVGESIAQQTAHMYRSETDNQEYQQQREARIQELIATDLQQLLNSRTQSAATPAATPKRGWAAKLRPKQRDA